MSTLTSKPSLGFTEAIRLASHRMTDFKGRSRRSEFWWFMLAFQICIMILQFILSLFLQAYPSEIITELLSFFALSATVRRLHDGGHSQWWVIVSWVSFIVLLVYLHFSGIYDNMMGINANPSDQLKMFTDPISGTLFAISAISSLVTVIFCIMDGKPEANKYGESPKYENN